MNKDRRFTMPVTLIALLVACASAPSMGQPEKAESGRMLRPNALIHIVEDVERSMDFYRAAVGFEVTSPPAPLTASALVHRAQSDVPSATARAATLGIPGSEMVLTLIEFSGIEGAAFSQRLYDPGVTRFSISVRDIDKAFLAVRERGVIVDSVGGEPVYTQRPRNDTRAVMMRDPDGFVFEFVESGNPVETDVPESSNIYNARSSLALENMDRSLAFYRDILGYAASPPNTANDAVLALEGTPDAVARIARTEPPGSTNVWFFWEFSEIARTKRAPRVQDPGASAISLLVDGLPALLDRMRAAGIVIETPGGQPARLAPNLRGVLVRSPDGLLVELIDEI